MGNDDLNFSSVIIQRPQTSMCISDNTDLLIKSTENQDPQSRRESNIIRVQKSLFVKGRDLSNNSGKSRKENNFTPSRKRLCQPILENRD